MIEGAFEGFITAQLVSARLIFHVDIVTTNADDLSILDVNGVFATLYFDAVEVLLMLEMSKPEFVSSQICEPKALDVVGLEVLCKNVEPFFHTYRFCQRQNQIRAIGLIGGGGSDIARQ
jgi:hypothetical protein